MVNPVDLWNSFYPDCYVAICWVELMVCMKNEEDPISGWDLILKKFIN